jgi:TonB family protein
MLIAVAMGRGEIYSVKDLARGVTLPQPKKIAPEPEFPANAGDEAKVGLVLLDQTTDARGEVVRSDVVAQTGPDFGEAAWKAARQWKYEPAAKAGQPVAFRQLVPVTFSREDNAQMKTRLANGGEAVLLGFPVKPPDGLDEKYRYDLLPVPVEVAPPVYPREQWMARKPGSATVVYAIDSTGRVVEAKIITATEPAFGEALAAAIESWRFKPAAKKDGTPTPAFARLKFDFNLYQPPDTPEVRLRDEFRDGEDDGEQFSAKGLDAPLRPTHTEPPDYPIACLEQAPGGGKAVIDCFVDRDGWVRLPRIVSSEPREEFGWAAAAAAARWRFEPPRRHGEPTVVRVQVPFTFKPVPAAKS